MNVARLRNVDTATNICLANNQKIYIKHRQHPYQHSFKNLDLDLQSDWHPLPYQDLDAHLNLLQNETT